jgi:hypothetical protein
MATPPATTRPRRLFGDLARVASRALTGQHGGLLPRAASYEERCRNPQASMCSCQRICISTVLEFERR